MAGGESWDVWSHEHEEIIFSFFYFNEKQSMNLYSICYLCVIPLPSTIKTNRFKVIFAFYFPLLYNIELIYL